MYCDINKNVTQIKSIIEWLITEIQSAGGDGDGIWYSKYYDIQEIKRIFTINGLLPEYWKLEEKDGELHIGDNQEWLLITNNENSFNSRPKWQQVSLVW